MIWLETKELYTLFLQSDWWRELSVRKRLLAGKCERCGNLIGLQAHHRVYRDNWFDTKLEDLECVCRRCHEMEHGLSQSVKSVEMMAYTYSDLQRARSKKLIGREEFLRLSSRFRPEQRNIPRRKKRRKHPPRQKKRQGCAVWYYNPTVRKRWVNRGTSSN